MIDTLKCLHQLASPGDLFPPTCMAARGHTGPHWAKYQGVGLGRVTWANDEEEAA